MFGGMRQVQFYSGKSEKGYSMNDLTLGLLIGGGFAVILGIILMIVLQRQGRAYSAQIEEQKNTQATLQDAAQQATQQQLLNMIQTTSTLEGRVAQLMDSATKSQAELTRTLEERFDKVSQRLGESLDKTTKNTTESLTDLKTRLAVIDEAQKHITELSGQVVGLQDILSNKQARGIFGEVQLNDIVQNALPPNAYSFQTTLGNGKRADCMILLPNPPGPIVVDAKFPLESYHGLRNAEDDAGLLQARKTFTNDLLKHVKDISEKYILPGETAESALMFLPSEAVYAELHASFPDIVEKSYKARVWIVSPTTLMATLNTVRAVLKDARMREQAGVIQQEVGKLTEDVGRLNKRVENLDKHFSLAEKDIREITTSSGKISRRAEKIEELQLEDKEENEAEKLLPL